MTNYIKIKDIDGSSLKEVIIINNDELLGHFVRDVDGFFYFSFSNSDQGLIDEYLLEELAYKLKLTNEFWNKHINEYFINDNIL